MTNFTWLFIQMLGALVLVSLGAVVILKYWLPKMTWVKRMQKTKEFELLSKFIVDRGIALYLVRIGNRFFALGGNEKGLQTITEVSKEELGETK